MFRRSSSFAAFLATATVAAPAFGASPPPPPAYGALHGVSCHRALDPVRRSFSVQVQMRALPAPSKVELLAVLQRRGTTGRFTRVPDPALTGWVSPQDATLGQRPTDDWLVDLPVQDLTAPASYRFVVTLHWVDAKGRVLRAERLISPPCRQVELRPVLVVLRPVRVSAPTAPGSGSGSGPGSSAESVSGSAASYTVRVSNQGRSAAGAFEVAFTQGGTSVTHSVPSLAPGAVATLRFKGAACSAAAPPRIVVDPAQKLDVASRSGSSVLVACRGR